MSATNTPTAQLPTVTHHRRRVTDATSTDQEKEKAAAGPAQVSLSGEETIGSGGGAAIRYLASRKRAAESWILRREECVLSACAVLNWRRKREIGNEEARDRLPSKTATAPSLSDSVDSASSSSYRRRRSSGV